MVVVTIPPKRCTACGQCKSRGEFHKRRASPDGLRPTCKLCHSQSVNRWYEGNKDRVRGNYKKWYTENSHKVQANSQRYYRSNKKKVLKNVCDLRKKKLTEDELYRATKALRNLISHAFSRKGYKKRSRSNVLLGCDFHTAKTHIESQFKPGMSWSNHGEWHIDHIVPLASESTIEGRERLCHYTNLQPLWAIDNMQKSSRIKQ